jgi:hypothetical protein
MYKAIWITVFIVAAIELGGAGVDRLLSTVAAEQEAFQKQLAEHREY